MKDVQCPICYQCYEPGEEHFCVKKVTCEDCGCSDFIQKSGEESGWEFIGYDDGVELHRCPSCILQCASSPKQDAQKQLEQIKKEDEPKCRCIDGAGDEPTCPVHYPNGLPTLPKQEAHEKKHKP
jgi:hypothetical protein